MPSADELIDIAAILKGTVAWRPSYRIVVSKFPSTGLFDRVATPDELEAFYFIESLTDPQLHQELGALDAVAREDWRTGPGTSPIMAAFTHPSPSGSRWSDGTYGVYYCAKTLSTAIAETKYHREQFLHQNRIDERLTVDMLVYEANLTGSLHNLCGQQEKFAALYDPDPASYPRSAAIGAALRAAGSDGIVYDSVREAGGVCAGLFRPRLLSPCQQAQHLAYVWNGERIEAVYEKRQLRI
jgi:RES domain-containing protein